MIPPRLLCAQCLSFQCDLNEDAGGVDERMGREGKEGEGGREGNQVSWEGSKRKEMTAGRENRQTLMFIMFGASTVMN